MKDSNKLKGLLIATCCAVTVLSTTEAQAVIGQRQIMNDTAKVEHLQALVQQNNANAQEQYELGLMREQGRGGLLQSDTAALQLYSSAARLGHAEAQYRIGLMHENGRGGLQQSNVNAAQWYSSAARLGSVAASVK